MIGEKKNTGRVVNVSDVEEESEEYFKNLSPLSVCAIEVPIERCAGASRVWDYVGATEINFKNWCSLRLCVIKIGRAEERGGSRCASMQMSWKVNLSL